MFQPKSNKKKDKKTKKDTKAKPKPELPKNQVVETKQVNSKVKKDGDSNLEAGTQDQVRIKVVKVANAVPGQEGQEMEDMRLMHQLESAIKNKLQRSGNCLDIFFL